jgi:hypothetical protein
MLVTLALKAVPASRATAWVFAKQDNTLATTAIGVLGIYQAPYGIPTGVKERFYRELKLATIWMTIAMIQLMIM